MVKLINNKKTKAINIKGKEGFRNAGINSFNFQTEIKNYIQMY